MFFKLIPGYILLVIIAVIATYGSKLVEVGGKHPIEPAVLAILIGMVLVNSKRVPQSCVEGVKAFEKPLIWGIVLMGASLNIATIISQGFTTLWIILITMTIGLITVYAVARAFKLSDNLSILLALGTSICGGTAIAVTAPLIKAKEEETSYAIGTIAIWGLLAIIIYPKLAQFLGVSDDIFGIFAGTAIHSTPQVVGAGFIFSEAAGRTATAVKLVRNCFLAPAAFLAMLWQAHREHNTVSQVEQTAVKKAFPWFLFGYFVMAWLNSKGLFSESVQSTCSEAGKFLILLGMVGVGLNTRFDSFRKIGAKPLIVGFVGAIAVATSSIILISKLLM
ncbi:MAG: putative sulfate exporter family transporter [Bdellovibrionales bacterium]|nr:putative sulfate exporter family transporter [Bdellovibrionales bacterium]